MQHREKKEQGASPAPKIVSTLNFPENLDLILIDGATLLVRVRAPPETWTTRLQPFGQPEPALVDHLFRLVTIFSNDCSKFEQSAMGADCLKTTRFAETPTVPDYFTAAPWKYLVSRARYRGVTPNRREPDLDLGLVA